jgi:hypothetical protein
MLEVVNPDQKMNPDEKMIEVECAGGCGTRLRYGLERTDARAAPTVRCLDSDCPFDRGHLCRHCKEDISKRFERRQKRRARLSRPPEEIVREVRERRLRKTRRSKARAKRAAAGEIRVPIA